MLKIHPKFWDVWIYRDPASSSLDLGSPQRRIPEVKKSLTWQQSSMTFLRILCLPMALASGFVLAHVSGAMRVRLFNTKGRVWCVYEIFELIHLDFLTGVDAIPAVSL